MLEIKREDEIDHRGTDTWKTRGQTGLQNRDLLQNNKTQVEINQTRKRENITNKGTETGRPCREATVKHEINKMIFNPLSFTLFHISSSLDIKIKVSVF